MTEDSGTEFLKQDAKSQGISWNQYCEDHGLVGESDMRKIRAHEVPLTGE